MIKLGSIALALLVAGSGPAAAQSISFTNTIPSGSDDGGLWGPILGVPINGWNRIFRCKTDPGQESPDFKLVNDVCVGGAGCNPCATFSFDVPNGPTSQALDFQFAVTYSGGAFSSSFALVPHGQPILPADVKDISDDTVEFVVGPDKIVVSGSHHASPEQCPLQAAQVPALGRRHQVGLVLVLAAAAVWLIALRSRGA
jgi:hypothetical protein